MEPDLTFHQTPSASAPNPALLFAQGTSFSEASARAHGAQKLLFARTAREICREAGLNWHAATTLHHEGWLSFAPDADTNLDESQEMELRFLGALVIAGCDRAMLTSILSGLSRPYAYDLRRVYYDWRSRSWRIRPDLHTLPEANFNDWVELLVRSRDMETLQGILELAGDALGRIRAEWPQPELYHLK